MNEKQFICIGKIVKPHGIKGEVKVQTFCNCPEILLEAENLFLSEKENHPFPVEAKVKNIRIHKKSALIKLNVTPNRTEAEKYRGWFVTVLRDELPRLEVDEYYVTDLIGINVETIEGREVGQISGVLPAAENDVFEIENPKTGKFNMVPANKKFIKSIDLEKRKMIVEPIEGLLEF